MRVCILCEYPTLNGGERSMLACVDRLAGECEFTFLAPERGALADELAHRSVRHVPFDMHGENAPNGREYVIRQLNACCAAQCDLLHANSLAMGRLSGAAAAAIGVPCTAHLRDIIRLSSAAVADLNGNARLVAVSQAVRDFHVAQGVAADRVCVVYNGIDEREFHPQPRSERLRHSIGIPDSAVVFASIGQICLRKGQDLFARAAALIARQVPEAHFVLVGARHSVKAESRAFEERIAAVVSRAGISERFHMLGERHDVPELLGAVDILVHAARQEPFGRVLLEAAAAGKAIIATDVGGTREMLTGTDDALLVPADDPHAIASAMTRLVRDVSLRTALGCAARRRVVGEFPIARSAAQLLDVWRQVLRSAGSAR